ncbi:MAG TPA: histidine kinase dimerization/phospho-acceptor domain-containing protein [Thermoanaerobaculaceae bacterium]|nr:histidine kinase dimerization/phospho-acceptor domain-containing protein [Thermoanaerobaculaceae bacterium]HRS16615.1 histidine kinase dimerization/phospho-acceptor domain-containing protein [Thermoanaerobaculaceae bacterium]
MEPFPRWELQDVVSRLGHQLRNPLATIQSGIELAQLLARPEGEAADCLAGALLEVARIDRILGDLQRLVRLAPGEPTRAAIPALAELAAARCTGCHAEIRLEGPEEMDIETDAELLGVALDELLGRAAAVTPPGEAASLRWGREDAGAAWIEVADGDRSAGPGSLRELLTTWPGSGLGPYLAERACALLGARLEWEALPARGHRFRIVLLRG